jgi:hypothetical protein
MRTLRATGEFTSTFQALEATGQHVKLMWAFSRRFERGMLITTFVGSPFMATWFPGAH